jgi:acylphosphatase
MDDTIFQLNCWYEGHVQGVGFRYQALQVAKAFEVTGEVRNLMDGRVYLLAEGKEDEVRAFAAEVAEELSSYIKTSEAKSGLGVRLHKGFKIGS